MTFLFRVARLLLLLAVALIILGAMLLWSRPGLLDRRGVELDLAAPPDRFSRARIVALNDRPGACRAVLDRAGIAYARVPARTSGDCGFADAVSWQPAGARAATYAPVRPALACPLATALAAWEWSVVQPAAERLLDTTVTRIDHFGSYACRRVYGRASGSWSEHARADAFDVAGFRLADGRRLTVAADWRGAGPEALFLHDVRDGA